MPDVLVHVLCATDAFKLIDSSTVIRILFIVACHILAKKETFLVDLQVQESFFKLGQDLYSL